MYTAAGPLLHDDFPEFLPGLDGEVGQRQVEGEEGAVVHGALVVIPTNYVHLHKDKVREAAKKKKI